MCVPAGEKIIIVILKNNAIFAGHREIEQR